MVWYQPDHSTSKAANRIMREKFEYVIETLQMEKDQIHDNFPELSKIIFFLRKKI